jgi:hypothetical protein
MATFDPAALWERIRRARAGELPAEPAESTPYDETMATPVDHGDLWSRLVAMKASPPESVGVPAADASDEDDDAELA